MTGAPVFISYSSKDRRIAQTLCQALEARGQKCWIAGRDVRAGENFQEAIVRALREARVMVLVFTSNANNSEEIKKEVVLAGRHHVTVVPVRAEDVIPSDAFAYEFATRQWIDLFQDWEQQIEQLVTQIAQILGTAPPTPVPLPKAQKSSEPSKMAAMALVAVLLCAGAALAIWRPWQHEPAPPVAAKLPAPATQAAAIPVEAAAPVPAPVPDAKPTTPKPVVHAVAAPASPSKAVKEKPSTIPAAAAPQVAAASPVPAPVPAAAPADPDEAAWQSAGSAASREGFGQYLKNYPAGHHAQEAQLQMANLILGSPATGRNFDGAWQTTWTCPNLGQYPGYTYQFSGQVTDGAYHGLRGVKGQPSSMVLEGKIESDGMAAFTGEVVVGSSLVGLGAARGTPSDFHAVATFQNSSASGRRIEGRACTLLFQRQ